MDLQFKDTRSVKIEVIVPDYYQYMFPLILVSVAAANIGLHVHQDRLPAGIAYGMSLSQNL